jgi:hypothetical protein
MHFNLAAAMAFASLAYTVLALATDLDLVNGTDSSPAIRLSKRNGKSFCCTANLADVPDDTAWFEMHIFTQGWGNKDETSRSGCGGGLLDNLRGQCGTVSVWGCEPKTWDGVAGTAYTFNIHSGPWPDCVQDAIWLASPKGNKEEGINCSGLCINGKADLLPI